MKVDRRRFIQDAAAAASIPALTYFVLPCSGVPARARLQSYPLAQRLPGSGSGASDLMFKIYGWQRGDLAASDCPDITPDGAESSASVNRPVLVGVSRSWRATWR